MQKPLTCPNCGGRLFATSSTTKLKTPRTYECAVCRRKFEYRTTTQPKIFIPPR